MTDKKFECKLLNYGRKDKHNITNIFSVYDKKNKTSSVQLSFYCYIHLFSINAK